MKGVCIMAVNINDLLPIGTVVSLKGAAKRLMIFGIKQISAGEKENIEFDYEAFFSESFN